MPQNFNQKMKTLFYFFLIVFTIKLNAQVGINTTNPEATLDIVGKPNQTNHYDGIIPPRITGDQLATKSYSPSKKGAIVYVTTPASILKGQVIHVVEEGFYFFNGAYWSQILKAPTYYDGLIILDETLPANTMSTTSTWNSNLPYPTNPRQHTHSYKIFRLGTAGLGISGQIDARRIGTTGYLDVSITCSNTFASNSVQLNIGKPLRELGFMSDGSVGSLNNILMSGVSKAKPNEIEQGFISLTNVDFELILWKNQIEKFVGTIKGMLTFPIIYLNVTN